MIFDSQQKNHDPKKKPNAFNAAKQGPSRRLNALHPVMSQEFLSPLHGKVPAVPTSQFLGWSPASPWVGRPPVLGLVARSTSPRPLCESRKNGCQYRDGRPFYPWFHDASQLRRRFPRNSCRFLGRSPTSSWVWHPLVLRIVAGQFGSYLMPRDGRPASLGLT